MLPHLIATSRSQSGAFSAVQVRAAGYTDSERRAHLKSGQWRVLRRGIYADEATLRAISDDPSAGHLLDIQACLLALGRPAIPSHTSACIAHCLGLVAPPIDVTLTATSGGTHRGEGLNVHVCELTPDQVTTASGLSVTTLARTVLDTARMLPFREAVPVADQALRRDPALNVALHELLRNYHTWPGIAAASRVIVFADGRAESVPESMSRVCFAELGLPPPDLQVDFWDERGFIGRTDFYWRKYRTIGEFDGRVKYQDKRDLYAEKLREDRLRVHDEVVRFGMIDITQRQPQLLQRIEAAFSRGLARPAPPRRKPWWP